jgi:chromosome segregation ATPase
MAEATSLRASENAAYKKASTDYKESAEAVAKAVSVLREFYGSAALLQMGQPEFGSSKSDSGNSIIAFLETAEQDFSRLLAEEETSESESLAAYNKYTQESKVTVAKKTAEKNGKESEIKSLKVALGNHKEDYSSTNKELDAVMEYLEKLKEQCTSKAHTYEERKAKREAEMEGLKQALDILSGDAPALLQTSKAFLARK